MNETRPPLDSIALHALARRERARLMAYFVRRALLAIARRTRALASAPSPATR
jgi:hypothetical protein